MQEEATGSLLATADNRQATGHNTERELSDATEALRVANECIRQLQARLLALECSQEHQIVDRIDAEHGSWTRHTFLATLSHELRTPLSAMLGWAQVLRRGKRSELDLQRGLATIERNARIQAQLIDDLLDISNLNDGKAVLNMQAIAPADIVMAAVAAARPEAHAKDIALTMALDPTALTIAVDPERIEQVIWNLLSNALKFTPRNGAVHIALQAFHAHVEITVSDTGVGIRPDFLSHVFEQFRQADSSTTRQHGGLGLGLSIAKRLIEQHGGNIRACSAGTGCGASFTLQLPLVPNPSLPTRTAAAGQR